MSAVEGRPPVPGLLKLSLRGHRSDRPTDKVRRLAYNGGRAAIGAGGIESKRRACRRHGGEGTRTRGRKLVLLSPAVGTGPLAQGPPPPEFTRRGDVSRPHPTTR